MGRKIDLDIVGDLILEIGDNIVDFDGSEYKVISAPKTGENICENCDVSDLETGCQLKHGNCVANNVILIKINV